MALQRSKGRTVRKAQVPEFSNTFTRSSYQSSLANIGIFYSESTVNTSDSGLDQKWNAQNITPGTVVPYGTTIGITYYVYVYPGFSHYGGFYHGFYHGFGHYAGFTHYANFAHYAGFTHYANFAHYAGFTHYSAFGHYAAFGHYGSFSHYNGFYHGFSHYGGFYHSFSHGYGGFSHYNGFSHGYGGFGHYGGFYHGFGHGGRGYSIGSNTGILTPNGPIIAENLKVGDKLLSLDISEIDMANFNPLTWTAEALSGNGVVETEIVSITSRVVDQVVTVNGDIYSTSHWILTRKDGVVQFTKSSEIDTTYEVYNYQTLDWGTITSVSTISYIDRVYTINCEPHDMFFTNSMLVYDRVE